MVEVNLATIETHVLGDDRSLKRQRHQTTPQRQAEAGLEHGTFLTGRCLVSDATTPQCQAEHAFMIRTGRTISPQCQAEDVSPWTLESNHPNIVTALDST